MMHSVLEGVLFLLQLRESGFPYEAKEVNSVIENKWKVIETKLGGTVNYLKLVDCILDAVKQKEELQDRSPQ